MAFDPDAFLGAQKQAEAPAAGFDPDSFLKSDRQPLVQAPSFDPVSYYGESPSKERMATAVAVSKERANNATFMGDAASFGKGLVEGIPSAVAGLAKGVGGLAKGAYDQIAGTPEEAARDRAEAVAAAQAGAVQGFHGLKNALTLPARLMHPDRDLSDQEWEDRINDQAAYNSTLNEIKNGGLKGWAQNLAQSPEELAKAGVPVRPENVDQMSFIGDPRTYLLGPAADVAGPLIGRAITAPILKTAAKAVGGVAEAAEPATGTLGTLAGLGYALHSASPLTAGLVFAGRMAGKAAPGLAKMLGEAGEEAAGIAPPEIQSLGAKAFKAGATGAVTGGVLGLPYAAGADTPEEAGAAIGGGIGLGGAIGAAGGIKNARAIDIAGKAGALEREGAAKTYGNAWDAVSQQYMAQLPAEAQRAINVFKGRYNGMQTANGDPVEIHVAGGADYQRAMAENLPGKQGADSRGFISKDGNKIFLNADYGKAPGGAYETMSHEAGGHLTEFLADISQKQDISTLRDALKSSLYDSTSAAPKTGFQRFIDTQKAALKKGGASPQLLSSLDNGYFEREFLAQTAVKILQGQNIAEFSLPPSIKARIMTGARRWMRSQGVMPERGADIGFGGKEISEITDQMRNILYKQGAQSEALRTDRAKNGEPPAKIGARMRQLERILAQPPTASSTTEEAKTFQDAQKEYEKLKALTAPSTFPAAGPAPVSPGAPHAPAPAVPAAGPAPDTQTLMARSDALDALRSKALQGVVPKEQHEARVDAAITAAQQAGIPITADNLLTHATTGRFQDAKPTISPPAGEKAKFTDESGTPRIVTGVSDQAPRVGDIVATRDGEIRRVTSALGGTIDTARPIDPLNARGTKTHKAGDYIVLNHDYDQTTPAAPAAKPSFTIEQKNGVWNVVNEKGEVIKGGLADEAAARRSMGQLLRVKKSIPGIPEHPAGAHDSIAAINDLGGILSKGRAPANVSGSYDDQPQIMKSGIYNRLMSDNADHTPDEVARLLDAEGIGDGTVSGLWQTIERDIKSRQSLRAQMDAEQRRQRINPNEPIPTVPAQPATPVESGGVAVAAPAAENIPAQTNPNPGLSEALNTAADEAERTMRASPEFARLKGGTKNTKEQRQAQEIARARLDAMAKAHAGTVPANSSLVTLKTDRFNRTGIYGQTINTSDPFHQELLNRAGYGPADIQRLAEIQKNLGRPIGIEYLSAPETPGAKAEFEGLDARQQIAELRRRAQAQSTAQDRAAGDSAVRRVAKSIVPEEIVFNPESNSFSVRGFSPDKFFSNVKKALPWLKAHGIDSYSGVNDPQLITDLNGIAENHAYGWRGKGDAPVTGTPYYPTKPTEGYKPYTGGDNPETWKDRFDVLNAMIGDTTAYDLNDKGDPKKGNPKDAEARKAKQVLARLNSPFFDPDTGEVNRVREMIRKSGDFKFSEASGFEHDGPNVLETARETLKPDLIERVGPPDIKNEHTLRPSGLQDGVVAKIEDVPRSDFTAAGFMPVEHEAQDSEVDSLGFYSKLRNVIASKVPNRAQPAQIMATLRSAGVKQEEMDSTGLPEWLKSQGGPVTKQEIQDFVKGGGVQLHEVQKGGVKPKASAPLSAWMQQYNSDPQTTGDWMKQSARLEKVGQQWQAGGNTAKANQFFDLAEESNRLAEDLETPSGGSGVTKFSQYVLPGGSNYKEVLLTLPEKSNQPQAERLKFAAEMTKKYGTDGFYPKLTDAEKARFNAISDTAQSVNFKSSHWDEPNVLAHIRQADHTDTEGNKVRLIEEIQSDWHQKGRKEGYRPEKEKQLSDMVSERDELSQRMASLEKNSQEYINLWEKRSDIQSKINDLGNGSVGVPDAPFKKTWAELAFKRALRMAVDDGVNKIAWTPGQIQSERYSLEKHVSDIYAKPTDGKFDLTVNAKDGTTIYDTARTGPVEASKLSDLVGKEMAQKIVEQKGEHTYSGLELKVGGSGMKGFYDQILPSFVSKYVKPMGGKVETTQLQTGAPSPSQPGIDEDGNSTLHTTVHSVTITPQMREAIQKGQAQFMPNEGPPTGLDSSLPHPLRLAAKAIGLIDGRSWGDARQFTAPENEKHKAFTFYLMNGEGPSKLRERYEEKADQFAKDGQPLPAAPKAPQAPSAPTAPPVADTRRFSALQFA